MKSEELKKRTKAFVLHIIKLVESLPKTRTADCNRWTNTPLGNRRGGELSGGLPGQITGRLYTWAVRPEGVTADHGCQYSAKAELADHSWQYFAPPRRDGTAKL